MTQILVVKVLPPFLAESLILWPDDGFLNLIGLAEPYYPTSMTLITTDNGHLIF